MCTRVHYNDMDHARIRRSVWYGSQITHYEPKVWWFVFAAIWQVIGLGHLDEGTR